MPSSARLWERIDPMKKSPLALVLIALTGSLHGQVLEVTSSGVGIGTTAPDGVFHVVTPASTDASQPRFFSGSSTAGQWNEILIGASLANYSTAILRHTNGQGSGTSALITLMHYGDPAANGINLKGGGNVGIGTANPGSRLVVDQAGSNTLGGRKTIVFSRTGSGEEFSIGSNAGGSLVLDKVAGTPIGDIMTWGQNGNVGIGTSSAGYKLTVDGSVRAASFVSDVTTYPDFVFQPGYKLAPLADVEAAIRRDGHLPDIPSETEVKAHGIDLAAQQVKLLQKVEELTLYVIELKRENEAQQKQLNALAARK